MQDNSIHNRLTLNCAGRLVVLENPLIMGILNTTPDSFHEASRTNLNNALEKAAEMVAEGVDILDIGHKVLGLEVWALQHLKKLTGLSLL